MVRERKSGYDDSRSKTNTLSRRDWLKATSAGTAAVIGGLALGTSSVTAADGDGHNGAERPSMIDRYVYKSGGTFYVDTGEGGETVATESTFERAVQTAINELSSGNVVVGDGTYVVNTPNVIHMQDGVNLYGRGGATIKVNMSESGSSDHNAVLIERSNNWTLDGFEFVGTSNQVYSSMIGDPRNTTAKYNITVSNCTFRYSTYVAINFDNVMGGGLIENCVFDNPTYYNGSGWNGMGVRQHSCEDVVIRDCVFDSTEIPSSAPLLSLLYIDDRNNLLENCEFYVSGNEAQGAIEFAPDGSYQIYGQEIRNCLFEGQNSGQGMDVWSSTTTSTNTVRDCTFRNLSTGFDDTASSGGQNVTGCRFESCSTDLRLNSSSTASDNTSSEEISENDSSDDNTSEDGGDDEQSGTHTYEVENTSTEPVDYFLEIEQGPFEAIEYNGAIINEELMWTDGNKAAGRIEPGKTHCWSFDYLLLDVTIEDESNAEARVDDTDSNLSRYPRDGATSDDWKNIEELLDIDEENADESDTEENDDTGTTTDDSGNRWSNASADDDWIVRLRRRIEGTE